MPTRHCEIALEWKAKHAGKKAACGKGEVGKSLQPGDKRLSAGVAVLQYKFFCRG